MKPKKVTIIGGGIAGMTAAWELAESGVTVDLIEKSGFLGGHAIQYTCKATSECLNCGACSVEKMLKNVVENDNITVHLSTEIEEIGKASPFSVKIKKSAVFIDGAKCTNCGICFDKLKDTGLIIRGYSKNNLPLFAINPDKLADNPNSLKEICPEGAIVVNAAPAVSKLTADAVIVATGFTPFNAARKGTYGYGRFPNVINGLDMERIKRQNGFLARPSDGAPAKKIAFIQCVGSRDENLGNLWCSQVCCPYALRSAESLKHKNPDLEITVFYMDIQNTGKSFPVFYESCKNDIRFIRSIPVDIFPEENGDLRMRLFDETQGSPEMETFDVVVLSTGIMPNTENKKLSGQMGIILDADGFFAFADDLNKTATAKGGIFIAGTAQGPKTIADSMTQAGQAAAGALKYLGVTK
ncbi:MAG: 4Fe-4S ferredoxin [Desulfobacterales bacterium CG23_combo_of_CG06-09_8_20_14_all_51_8]|nr:MAG: 4Fe-4S ferredoxin [Desulfobacterales bacterium CG23_combo_of_CG06-09_8_20_14_all_51_8]